jgi:peptidase E
MTIVFERVKTAMDTLSPAIAHSLSPYKAATLPATYIVYELIIGSPEQHADNAETQRSYVMQVTIWATAGFVSLPNVDAAMLAAGFQKSDERQLPQDQESGHYGLAKDFVYLE